MVGASLLATIRVQTFLGASPGACPFFGAMRCASRSGSPLKGLLQNPAAIRQECIQRMLRHLISIALHRQRVRLFRIQLPLLDGAGDIFRIHLAFGGKRGDGGMRDPVAINLEESAQLGA